MLPERDPRTLAGIERALTDQDPALARRMRHPSAVRVWVAPTAVALLGLLLALGLVVVHLIVDAVVVLVVLAWPLARRAARRWPPRRTWTRMRHRIRRHTDGRGTATTGV